MQHQLGFPLGCPVTLTAPCGNSLYGLWDLFGQVNRFTESAAPAIYPLEHSRQHLPLTRCLKLMQGLSQGSYQLQQQMQPLTGTWLSFGQHGLE